MLKLDLPISHIFGTRVFYILNRKLTAYFNSVLVFIKDLNSYKYPKFYLVVTSRIHISN